MTSEQSFTLDHIFFNEKDHGRSHGQKEKSYGSSPYAYEVS
jgi:hypothetical protein